MKKNPLKSVFSCAFKISEKKTLKQCQRKHGKHIEDTFKYIN